MGTHLVSTRAELVTALLGCKGGDTIRLADVAWPMLNIGKPRQFDKHVIVEPVARNTLIPGWTWKGWGGIHMRGFKVQQNAASVIALQSVSNFILEDCRAIGFDANRDPWDDGETGVRITSSVDVAVKNCDLTDLYRGIAAAESKGVDLDGNRIWQVREGLTLGALRDSFARRNEISEIYARYHKSEHPDAIQVQNAGLSSGCHGLEISDNKIALFGQRACHGGFATVQSTLPEMRHSRISFLRNLIVNSAKHGISLGGCDDALVAENVVLRTQHATSGYKRGQDGGLTSAGLTPRIALGKTCTGVCRDNFAPWYGPKAPGVEYVNNRAGWPAAPEAITEVPDDDGELAI